MKKTLKRQKEREFLPKVVAKSGTPAEAISQAISSGADLDKLEKLLALQERWEANEAKKAYHRAMTAFKANPPDIEKDMKVAFGTTKYNHASHENVTSKINAAMSPHGLYSSWRVSQNGTISVTCKITHEQGHSEEVTMTAPADTSGSKNAIQSIGSAIKYLQRYTLLAIAGMSTHEMDDDGKGAAASAEKITVAEADSLLDHLSSIEADMPKFLAWMKIEKVEDMLKSDLKKAMTMIEAARAKKGVRK